MINLPPADDSTASSTSGPGGELARLVQGGLPLVAGLRACAEESTSRFEQRSLRHMAARLETGAPMEEALIGIAGLPAYLKQLAATGVRTGQLAQLLADYLILSRQRRDLRHQLVVAGAYPLLTLLALLLVGSIFPLWMVPQFKVIFDDFAMELPAMTQAVIDFSDVVLVTWRYLVGAMVVFFVVVVGHRWLPGCGVRQWMIRQIPLFGPANVMAGRSEFCLLLAMLMRAQLDLNEALELLGTSLEDRSLRRESARLAKRLSGGETMSDQLHRSSIPVEVIRLFGQVTSTDELAGQLRMYGRLYALQAKLKLRQALVLLEPALIIFAATAAGFLILSLMLPLLRLVNGLS